VKSDWEVTASALAMRVDAGRAAAAGVSDSEVASSLNRFLLGQPVTSMRDGDELIPVMLRGPRELRRSAAALPGIQLGDTSDRVTLGQVADFELRNEYSSVAREDMVRTATVTARNVVFTPEDIIPHLSSKLNDIEQRLPPGHHLEVDGIVMESQEGQAALQANLPLCLVLMFLLLVAQFNSVKKSVLVFLTMPLIVIGAAIGLHVLRAEFGFMVILGLYSLAGIIVNNAIVLIDRIDIVRAEGGYFTDAVVAASKTRLRPIVMTTVTTVLGLMPLILNVDPLFYGMAATMAFGLMVGTVITLGFVPVVYSLMFSRGARSSVPARPGAT
ncbi:MAG: efflux RND transporter permease subunit, partial [Myxococcota bacterium]